MKKIDLKELSPDNLLKNKEVLSVEYRGKTMGYYYPVIDDDKVKKAREDLDLIMEKVLLETGLTEDEYAEAFFKNNNS